MRTYECGKEWDYENKKGRDCEFSLNAWAFDSCLYLFPSVEIDFIGSFRGITIRFLFFGASAILFRYGR